MNLQSFISLTLIITSAFYLSMGLLINATVKGSNMRRACLLAFIVLSIRSLCYSLMTNACCADYAHIFWAFGFFVIMAFFPCWLVFLTFLTSSNTKKNLLFIVLHYAFTAILTILCIKSNIVQIVDTAYGYQYQYSINLIFVIFMINALIYLYFGMRLLLKFINVTVFKRDKNMAVTLAKLTAIFLPAMLFLDFVRPIIFTFNFPPIGLTIMGFVAFYIYRIMKTYRAFDITIENISQDMFNSLSMTVLILNEDNDILFANDFAENFIIGRIKGQNITDIVEVNAKSVEDNFFEQSFESNRITVFSHDGVKNCNMLLKVVRDTYGDVLHKIVIINDTTELVDATIEVEDRLRLVIDSIPIPITIWSQDIEMVGCNKEAMRQLGVDNKSDFITLYSKLIPEYQKNGLETSVVIDRELKKTLQLGYNYVKWTHLSRNGELKDMDLTLVRVKISDDKFEILCYVKWG